MNNEVPKLTSNLKKDVVIAPKIIEQASGIEIFGKNIKKIIFTTDVAVIANCDADAILAVYPWTPNTRILEAINTVATIPVLAGIGGGLTKGLRSVTVGRFAEERGVSGVVLNAPTKYETIKAVRVGLDVPIFYTVVSTDVDLKKLIKYGVSAFNVAAASKTADVVAWIREELGTEHANFPIIASGGKTEQSIIKTIEAGANAITYSANSLTETIFREKMDVYRGNE